MTNSNSTHTTFSRVHILHAQQNLTNVSARWQPDANMSKLAVGRLGITLLAGVNNSFSITGMLVTTKTGLSAVFAYHAPNRASVTERMPVSQSEPVYLELDVDPATSNVIFWINDTGLDMGVLPGFKGGAASARWHSGANCSRVMLSGKLMDCAVATLGGWKSTAFRDGHINTTRLHDSHAFNIVSSHAIAIGQNQAFA